jgi:hypothetical protein
MISSRMPLTTLKSDCVGAFCNINFVMQGIRIKACAKRILTSTIYYTILTSMLVDFIISEILQLGRSE